MHICVWYMCNIYVLHVCMCVWYTHDMCVWYICMHMYMCMCMCVCMWYMCEIYIYICLYVCDIHVMCVYVCVSVCASVCGCVCVCVRDLSEGYCGHATAYIWKSEGNSQSHPLRSLPSLYSFHGLRLPGLWAEQLYTHWARSLTLSYCFRVTYKHNWQGRSPLYSGALVLSLPNAVTLISHDVLK